LSEKAIEQDKTMKRDKGQIISAEVLLRSATGHKIGPDTIINAENLNLFTPPPDAYAVASGIFRSLGFEVGPLTGISFSITAAVSNFENIYKTLLRFDRKGGVRTAAGKLELDTATLPAKASALIQSIVFSEPPDFGPSEF
jgi:hypothetical protein